MPFSLRRLFRSVFISPGFVGDGLRSHAPSRRPQISRGGGLLFLWLPFLLPVLTSHNFPTPRLGARSISCLSPAWRLHSSASGERPRSSCVILPALATTS